MAFCSFFSEFLINDFCVVCLLWICTTNWNWTLFITTYKHSGCAPSVFHVFSLLLLAVLLLYAIFALFPSYLLCTKHILGFWAVRSYQADFWCQTDAKCTHSINCRDPWVENGGWKEGREHKMEKTKRGKKNGERKV